MKNGIELLQEILAQPHGANKKPLAPNLLRFVLEYKALPNLDAERAVFTKLLSSSAFVLEPLFHNADLREFLVLSFPSVERTLPDAALFTIAYQIADARDLVSAEPDVNTPIYFDPEPPTSQAGIESAVIAPSCRVNTEPPADTRWSLEKINIHPAWALSKGAGILIAQPDTGIAQHSELDATSLRLDLAKDILGDGKDPTDPLTQGTANPGHGTGTASVVISRQGGKVTGSAPEASLIPIRCAEDVKIFEGAPVAAAIDHARKVEAHVITMSLGGLPSRAIKKAIEKAIDAGIIVLAAAGNCVRTVVWPARYDNVIAVAGINQHDNPWIGSCRGNAVDISAPAEQVWRAERSQQSDPVDQIGPGQGTSFAVATTAGVAALWLSHHTRAAVMAEADTRGVSVQRLFLAALKTSARSPAGWDHNEFGAGILDAGKLLELRLADLNTPAVEANFVVGRNDVRDLLAEIQAPVTASLDWEKYGLEIANLVMSGAPGRAVLERPWAELGGNAPPSAELRRQLEASGDPGLITLANKSPSQPPLPRSATPDKPTESFAILSSANPAASESALGSNEPIKLSPSEIKNRMDGIEKVLKRSAEHANDEELKALRAHVLNSGEQLLQQVGDAPKTQRLSGGDRLVLEAMVMLHGRPALAVKNGTVECTADTPECASWSAEIEGGIDLIEARLPSIGRIDSEQGHIGTGFVVAPGLLMTNRHVIEAFAAPVPARNNPTSWIMLSDQVTIDFSENPDATPSPFKIKGVIFSGPSPIMGNVRFSNLDLALLEVETQNKTGTSFPTPLKLSAASNYIAKSKRIFIVGYPAAPYVPPMNVDGVNQAQVNSQLAKIFGVRYGRKYFSPGLVSGTTGNRPDDTSRWVFDHDALTLSGSSGSCTFFLGDPMDVVGLHFAGDWMRANHAHSIAAIRPHLSGIEALMAAWGNGN